MSQLSLSAVGTGRAVVVSGYERRCRRVVVFVIAQRLCGSLALSGGARCEVQSNA